MRTIRRRARGPTYYVTLGLWAIGLMTALLLLTLVDSRVASVPVYSCPPDCGRPPTGLPVSTNPVFTAPSGDFSVSHPAPGAAYDVSTGANGVTAELLVGDRGTLRLFGEPAAERDAAGVVRQVLDDAFPDHVVAYELPYANLGFQNGYGVVVDFPQPGAVPRRVIAIAAVKNDLALVALASGPFRRFTPEFGPGPPSAANLQIAQEMGKYVNTFSWRGDPPR